MQNVNSGTIKKEFANGLPGHVMEAEYFYFDYLDRNQNQLAIVCGGHERCAPDFKLDRRNFPFFALIFTIDGSGTFEIHNKIHKLHPGQITAFGSNKPYKLASDKEKPMEQIFILFQGVEAHDLLKRSTLDEKNSVNADRPEAILSILGNILYQGMNQNALSQEICCNYLRGILLEQSNSNDELVIQGSSYESFQRCKKYADNNFTNINSSTQLAMECCLNVRYVARLFKKYENIRPYEYLIRLKLRKAATLLLTTSFNVNQIAVMTGFEDPYHFSRVFKSKFGFSPTEYRKNGL